jgi:hypothetical protein
MSGVCANARGLDLLRHPQVGTGHCLRDDEYTCVNDHTGCLWNDGHNECMHESVQGPGQYDSPLRKKKWTVRCRQCNGPNLREDNLMCSDECEQAHYAACNHPGEP